jgi:hypothetical protein
MPNILKHTQKNSNRKFFRSSETGGHPGLEGLWNTRQSQKRTSPGHIIAKTFSIQNKEII